MERFKEGNKHFLLLILPFLFFTFCACFNVYASPGMVTGLKQTHASTSGVKIEWNETSDARYYQVAIDSNDDGSYAELAPRMSKYDSIYSLKSGVTYHVRIRGANRLKSGEYEYGPYCEPIEVVTAPLGRTEIMPTNVTETSMSFYISSPPGTNIVKVSYYPAGENGNTQTIYLDGSDVTIRNLDNHKLYMIEMTSERINSSKTFEAEGSKTTIHNFKLVPGKITDFSCISANGNQLTFSWPNINNDTRYELVLYDSDGEEVKTIQNSISRTDRITQTIRVFECGKYEAKVRGFITINGTNYYGEWSDECPCQTEYPNHNYGSKSVMSMPTCTNEGRQVSYCTLCNNRKEESIPKVDHEYGPWRPFNDIEHRRYCRYNSLHTQSEKHNWNNGEIITQATATTQDLMKYTCLVCGATKHERIEKLSVVYPDNVTILKAAGGKGKITVSWKKTKNADGYIIYRSDKQKSGFKKIATVKGAKKTSYINKNIKKGTKYYYKIKAYRVLNGKTVLSKKYSAIKFAKAS